MDTEILALVALPVAFGTASLLTGMVRRYALSRALVDIPNPRSSHLVPTPRGGGLAIVLTFLASVACLYGLGHLSGHLTWALMTGGSVVALAGWLDDHVNLPVGIRLAAQFLAATAAVVALNGFESLELGWYKIPLGISGSLLAVVGIVWMVNLYNFMDGIDGIAGVEAVTTAIFAGLFLAWKGAPGLAILCAVLASTVAGFLVWNWPPAKIFMGDVGSGFLGYVFGVVALATEKVDVLPVFVWIILLGVFICDASVTLITRLKKKEKVWQAHRNHFYQRAVQAGYSHRFVTSWTGMLNVLLGVLSAVAVAFPRLLPLAAAAGVLLLATAASRISRMEKIRNNEKSGST
jgi:Fuc2NAc and GlcNAc transferase